MITQSTEVWLQHPVKGEAHQRASGGAGGRSQFLHGIEVRFMPVAVQVGLVFVEACAGLRRGKGLFPGEDAAGEWIVGDGGNAEFAAHRQKFLLDAAREQVVHRLGDVHRPAVFSGRPARACASSARRRSWRRRHGALCPHAAVQPWRRATLPVAPCSPANGGSRDRDSRFGADADCPRRRVGWRRARGRIGRGRAPFFRRPCWRARPCCAGLSRPGPKSSPSSLVVDVGRIDEVDAVIEAGVEEGAGGGLIGLSAECHRAAAETRDLELGVREKAGVHES
jgi:hypothetical protein